MLAEMYLNFSSARLVPSVLCEPNSPAVLICRAINHWGHSRLAAEDSCTLLKFCGSEGEKMECFCGQMLKTWHRGSEVKVSASVITVCDPYPLHKNPWTHNPQMRVWCLFISINKNDMRCCKTIVDNTLNHWFSSEGTKSFILHFQCFN